MKWHLWCLSLAFAVRLTGQNGAALFQQACATCHTATGAERVPSEAALRRMTAARILQVLQTGIMKQQAAGKTEAELRAIAEHLGTKPAPESPLPAACKSSKPFVFAPAAVAWNGWGNGTSNLRFQPQPGFTAAEVPRLRLKWAFGFPGDSVAQAQPTVAGGRVFVGSASGQVYALDTETGCTHWTYKAAAAVRTAPSVGPRGSEGNLSSAVYFGDLQANVYALDAATGALLWKATADTHPAARITGAPTLYQGRLFVPVSSMEEASAVNPRYACCTFRGSVVALDAESGKQIWKTYTIEQAPGVKSRSMAGKELLGPSGAGIWSAPTIDPRRGVLYVATGDQYTGPGVPTSDAVLALRLSDGVLVWGHQATAGDAYTIACNPGRDSANCPEGPGPDHDFGSSAMLVTLAGGSQVLLAGQKSGVLHGLDPNKQGALLWSTHVGKGGFLGGIQWGPAVEHDRVYVALSDVGWSQNPQTRKLQLNPEAGGGLFALQVATGEKLWSAAPPLCGSRPQCSPAQSAAVTAIPSVVFSGALDGVLRAYSSRDGAVLWSYDTARSFTTVNGLAAQGGAIDAAGPVVAGGLLLVNSGYGSWGGRPGNVLLAFTTEPE